MGVVLSPDFDPQLLPGLSLGKQRRQLTSKYDLAARRKAESLLAESAAAAAAESSPAESASCSQRADRGASASTSGRDAADSWMTHEQCEVRGLMPCCFPPLPVAVP